MCPRIQLHEHWQQVVEPSESSWKRCNTHDEERNAQHNFQHIQQVLLWLSSFQGVRILADARFYLILAFSAKNLGYVDRTFLTNKEALVVVVGEWENPLIIPRNIEHVYRIAWIYVQYM